MVLDQPFVLLGDGAGVILPLWIEDHHRDVKTPEHHAWNHGVLAPLQQWKCGWASRCQLLSRPHQPLEIREKGPLSFLYRPDPKEHVEKPVGGLVWRVAHDLHKHVEVRRSGDHGDGIRQRTLDLLGGLTIEHPLERPCAAVGHQKTEDSSWVLVVHGRCDRPALGRAAEDGCGNPQVIEQPDEVVRNVGNTEVEVRHWSETVAAIVDGEHAVSRGGESGCDVTELVPTAAGAVGPDEGDSSWLAPLEVVHPDAIDVDVPAVDS